MTDRQIGLAGKALDAHACHRRLVASRNSKETVAKLATVAIKIPALLNSGIVLDGEVVVDVVLVFADCSRIGLSLTWMVDPA